MMGRSTEILHRGLRGVLALMVLAGAVNAAEDTGYAGLPLLNEGHAPQLGDARIYGQTDVPVYGYHIIETFAHDPRDYTEALFFYDGNLYEGTGRHGQSWLKIWDLQSGKVLNETRLEDRYFGEGAVILNDKLFHLTYTSNTGFIYDPISLEQLAAFEYPFQGWGLTTDGQSLIMSNGSSAIMFLDPETLAVTRTILVRDQFGPVGFLNELEYVDGDVYANVWQTNYIVRFSAETGQVTGWLDLSGLNPDPKVLVYPYVLNGIAYDGEPDTLYVTGKEWPGLWHIRLIEHGAE